MERAALAPPAPPPSRLEEEAGDGTPPQQSRPRAPQTEGRCGGLPGGGASGSGRGRWAAGGRGLVSQGWRGRSCALYFSSSSEDEFEMFLARMKTPKSVSKKAEASLKDFIDDSDDFFLDLKVKKSTTKNAQKDLQEKRLMTSGKKNTCCQELRYSESSSDSEDSVFLQNCDYKDDYQEGVKNLRDSWRCIKFPPSQNLKDPISRGSPELLVRRKERSCEKGTENIAPSVTPRQSRDIGSDSSDEEFESLIERIRKRSVPRKPVLSTSKTVYQPSVTENIKPPCEDAQPLKGEGFKTPRSNSVSLQETPSRIMSPARIPRDEPVSCSQSAKTEKRLRVCSVPGCFLQDLSNPASPYVKYFKKNKEELAEKLYSLYNNTIFEQKGFITPVMQRFSAWLTFPSLNEQSEWWPRVLDDRNCYTRDLDDFIFEELPEKMKITWNKKMRKTAGYCVTGQTEGPEAKRYARIELSEKVCDSADRLRDTLIHEACHAATWLINGVRDGHGRFWRFYANKSTVIHPELPVVTRCHSYEINYKFIYECVRCKATIGRHSKSLDRERFVCAFCGGQLVLRQPTGKDGTPARTHLTPFANYVKENYRVTKREQRGLSHAEVMRKLSADFALKTRLQNSL